MAGLGAKLWTVGEIATAANINGYLMDQTVMKFASTTTRDAAFGGAGEPTLSEGMFAYTSDTDTLWLYDGSNWVNVLGSNIGQQALSNRNVVINGAMQVAQRGTSTAGVTDANNFGVDRFQSNIATLGTWTVSQESDAPTGSGFRKSLKYLVTTADASPAAADFCAVIHKIEGQNVQQFLKGTASAKQFSLIMWVKSGTTGTYIAELIDNDNARYCSQSYTISVADTWEKKTLVFPADTTGVLDNDNALSLAFNFYLAAGSTRNSGTLQTVWGTSTTAGRATGQVNLAAAAVALTNYWQVTGVQLEVGSVATPFEFEQISTTLNKCQRYYQKLQNWTGLADTTTDIAGNMQFLCEMRAAPTTSKVAGSTVYWRTPVADNSSSGWTFGAASSTPTSLWFQISSVSGLTAGQATHNRNGANAPIVEVSAEL